MGLFLPPFSLHVSVRIVAPMKKNRRIKLARKADAPPASSPLQKKRALAIPPSARRVALALFPPRTVLYLAFFAWYLSSFVDVRLVFQYRDRLFLWNQRFFTDFLGEPGSLLDWADRLYVQLCYFGWPGVAFLVAAAWLVFIATDRFMSAVGKSNVERAWVVPALILTASCCGYNYPASAAVGLAAAMLGATAFAYCPAKSTLLRSFLFAAISLPLYYAVGEAYYVFTACSVIYEAMTERRRQLCGVILVVAVAVIFGLNFFSARYELGTHHFQRSMAEATLDWRTVVLYAYYPICAIFVSLYDRIVAAAKNVGIRLFQLSGWSFSFGRKKGIASEAGGLTAGSELREWLRQFFWVGETAVVLFLTVCAGFVFWDPSIKSVLEMQRFVEEERWDDALELAKNLPFTYYTHSVNADVNFALYKKGRLSSDMFSYPQVLMTRPQQTKLSFDMLRQPSDVLLEAGRVNEAERFNFEILEMWTSGAAYKRLAWTRMIKGEVAAAKTFLNVLRDDLIWSDWAEKYLRRLEVDPALASDSEIQRIRSLAPPEDDIQKVSAENADKTGYEPNFPMTLFQSWLRNRKNRAAYEFLMGSFLVSGNVRGVVETFPALDEMGYASIPPLYEEAAVINGLRYPKEMTANADGVFCRGRRISDATMERFRKMLAYLGPDGKPNEEKRSLAAYQLGQTYFFYYYYIMGRKP